MWLIHFDSKDNLGYWWNECQFEGYEGHKFMKKLQFVKSKLKEWNKVSFVLANRLKKVLGKVVFVDQNAFVRDRQILDASLIANEVIDFWHKRKEKWLICKLDIEKVYDSINWNFLMKVLHKMGFGSRWMEWIWWCISTAKFSVMVNGVPTSFFSNSRDCVKEIPFLLTFLSWVWKC